MVKWRKIRRTLRSPIETGGFLLLRYLIPILPRSAVVAFARLAGWTAMLLPLKERRIGLQNLDAVFGGSRPLREKRRILACSYSTFTQAMLDLFWFSKNTEKRIGRYVELEDSPALVQLLAERPMICITAHFGNWEIMGQTVALKGIDIASIAATVKNRTVDRMVIELREKTGQTIIPQQGALRTLMTRFRNNGKAGFVLDQNTSEKEGGTVVDFLGLPMPVSAAPAALSYRTGTNMVIGFCYPEPGGRYRIHFPHLIKPPPFCKDVDSDLVARELTQQVQDRISEEIRAHPEYWLWSYRHWRRIRGESYPDGYPDYRR